MYKYLLVPATGAPSDEAVFATAFLAAEPFAGHLEFLHVSVDVTEVVVSMSTGGLGGSGAVQGVVDKLQNEARQTEGRAWQAVQTFCSRHGISREDARDRVSAGFVRETGNDAQWISEYGRFADLVVVGRAQPGREMAMEVLEAALMDTGRPLLIASPEAPQSLLGTVVIAWKDTPEAARAVAAALPLIERARDVVILSVSEDEEIPEQGAERLQASLRWHNPAVSLRSIARPNRCKPVEVLLEEVRRLGASLVVMGGYSHSRLREVVFGGFTHRVLAGVDVPVIMAH